MSKAQGLHASADRALQCSIGPTTPPSRVRNGAHLTPPSSDPLPRATRSRVGARRLLGFSRYAGAAFGLVWDTDRRLCVGLVAFTVSSGLLPASVAYLGKLIIDGVTLAVHTNSADARAHVLVLVGVELVLVALLVAVQRGLAVCDALLRVSLAQRVLELVLNKALSLSLSDFENPALYDQLRLVREQAAERPLSLVRHGLLALQLAVSLLGFLALLAAFSPWIMVLLLATAVPTVIAEARFNADAFRLFRAHSPEARRQSYLETILTREDHAKEVKAFGLGPTLLSRHRQIFERWYLEDRSLTLRRGAWGFGLSVLAALALAASYAYVSWQAMAGAISVGALAMLFAVLRQAQSAATECLLVVASMYDDNLYIATLHEFLDYSSESTGGAALTGPDPGDGLRFEDVEFSYPGAATPALKAITLHLPPGAKLAIVGRNGAGKSTFVKLALGLYKPSRGRVLLDGRALCEWAPHALSARFSVLFQDFVRYQLPIEDNIGFGDLEHAGDVDRYSRAAARAQVRDLIESLPEKYKTQLGHWFEGGHELSVGEWQKIALARAFVREQADILVLDEPSASLDGTTERRVLEHFRDGPSGRSALLISHRASTLRFADSILMLDGGRPALRGRHEDLILASPFYAALFACEGTD